MLHDYYEIREKLIYWSNSCGDLHHNGEYDIEDESGLPKELQRVLNDLWR